MTSPLLLAETGVIGRFASATFDNFAAQTEDQQHALSMCRSLADKVPQFPEEAQSVAFHNLWLVGRCGTGKTHLGAAMVNHVNDEIGLPAGLLSILSLLRIAKQALSPERHPDASSTIRALGHLQLLVLDDFDVKQLTEWERAEVHHVIDMRYRLELPTVVISNLSAPHMRPRMSEGTFDRLMDRAVILSLDGPSHRRCGRDV